MSTGNKRIYTSKPGYTLMPTEKSGAYPGKTLFADRLAGLDFTHYPVPVAAGNPNVLTSFASPPDPAGKGYLVPDFAVRPFPSIWAN